MIPKNLSNAFYYLLLGLLFCSASSYGNQTKKQDMIYMEANNVQYDYKKGIVNYEGKVHAKQGITDLLADKMIIYYNDNHKIKKIMALGDLARYKTLLNDKDILIASAKTIYYYPIIGKVILEKEAKVEYNQNQFMGPYIFYDMNNKVISSHPRQNSQSRIVLEPIKQLKNQMQ